MENIKSGVKLQRLFRVECYRKGEPIWAEKAHNIVTNEGLDRSLDVMVGGKAQISTWYCGLVETNTTATATMTYDVPIFTESTAYDEATRPAYVEATATAGSVTNAANKATFTINATKTMYGAALFSKSTKGDHPAGADNVLYCYAKFSAERAVVDDDVINLTYVVTSADDAV